MRFSRVPLPLVAARAFSSGDNHVSAIVPHITIIGASARAAAESARRANLSIWAADLFADEDLKLCGPAPRIENYPTDLPKILATAPAGPWMYTGALENYPDLIDELATIRPLYGNSGVTLRTVRDPFTWSRVLSESGIAAARCLPSSRIRDVPTDGTWLIKPLASAGGNNIRVFDESTSATVKNHAEADPWKGFYFQERLMGRPVGAVYIGNGRDARLLGVTRQIVGQEWLPSDLAIQAPFRYCGSIGTLQLTASQQASYERLGQTLSRELGVLGLFGVDAIQSSEQITPIEINPRYTASIEILERSTTLSAISLHIASFQRLELPTCQIETKSVQAGKAILFAPFDCRTTGRFFDRARPPDRNDLWPNIADISPQPAVFLTGQPIATFFAEGRDELAIMRELCASRDDAVRNLQRGESRT